MDNNLAADTLLQNAARELADRKPTNESGKLNVFKALDVVFDERKICRMIYALIDTSGSNKEQAQIFLGLFFKHVLGLGEGDAENALVHREYALSIGSHMRYIDIVIETNNHKLIPIKVKINACDQYNQCADYYMYTSCESLYYLTLTGSVPTPWSTGGMERSIVKGAERVEGIRTISFSKSIKEWLSACMDNETVVGDNNGILMILQQFNEAVGILVNERNEEIMALTRDNIEAAVAISNELPKVMADKMKELLDAIAKQVAEKLTPKLLNTENINEASYFYQKRALPSISFTIGWIDCNGKRTGICVSIEITDKLYIGVNCPVGDPPSFSPSRIDFDLVERILGNNLEYNRKRRSNWWYSWDYIDIEGGTQRNITPDFRNPNDAYYELYNAEKFISYVNLCVRRMVELIRRVHGLMKASTVDGVKTFTDNL